MKDLVDLRELFRDPAAYDGRTITVGQDFTFGRSNGVNQRDIIQPAIIGNGTYISGNSDRSQHGNGLSDSRQNRQ